MNNLKHSFLNIVSVLIFLKLLKVRVISHNKIVLAQVTTVLDMTMYGCHHNRETGATNPTYPAAFGFLMNPPVNSGFRTIMA